MATNDNDLAVCAHSYHVLGMNKMSDIFNNDKNHTYMTDSEVLLSKDSQLSFYVPQIGPFVRT